MAGLIPIPRSNERPGVDAGWRVLFAFQRPPARATQAGCSRRPVGMRNVIAFAAALLLDCSAVKAADESYEQVLSALAPKDTPTFISDARLVDTNNVGPLFGNKPLPFSAFVEGGELGGIKFGMTMSQVVASWGKPRELFTRCGIGPRFWYGHTVSLFFRDGRLVRIVLSDQLLKGLVFDNGLKGTLGSTEVAAVIGSSLSRRNEEDFLSYSCAGGHLDFGFHHVSRTPTSAWQKEELSVVILGRGDENKVGKTGEQNAAPL